jgi:hypothetical protein
MKNDREAEKPDRRSWEPREPNDVPLTPGSHEQLWQIAIKLPTDFEPYGQRKRDVVGDCSCNCRWFLALVAMPGDWGVCANPASPRVGLLTFEHQGCPQFEYDSQEEEVNPMESILPEPSSPNLDPEHHHSRGMLVVDGTLLGLVPFLEDRQFWVRTLKPGMDNEVLSRATAVRSGIGYLLGGRILVTDRAEKFRHAAAVHEFSIIDTAGYTQDPSSVAEEIAEHWTQLEARGAPYILRLRRYGEPMLERVEE